MRRAGRWRRRTADLREHRDVRRSAETVDAQRMSTSSCGDGKEPDITERVDDVATNEVNEDWAYVEEQQVVEQTTEESQDWCMHKMHDGRQVGCRKDP